MRMLYCDHTPQPILLQQYKEAEPPKNLIDYVDSFYRRLHTAGEQTKENLISAQSKMKKLYDQWAECRVFSVRDQVLPLLPVATAPFQAKYTGPYKVTKRISEHN